jgi:hypothetical protein
MCQNLEIRNIRAYISQKIREIDGVLKQKNVTAETTAIFKKRKSDLIKSRLDLISKFKSEKRSVLDAQCKKTFLELSDEKLIRSLTSFQSEPLSLVDIMDVNVKRKKKNKYKG